MGWRGSTWGPGYTPELASSDQWGCFDFLPCRDTMVMKNFHLLWFFPLSQVLSVTNPLLGAAHGLQHPCTEPGHELPPAMGL